MWIKMTTKHLSQDEYDAQQVQEVPDAEANALIEGGFAEPTQPPAYLVALYGKLDIPTTRVRMLDTIHMNNLYVIREVYRVQPSLAKYFVHKKWAEYTDDLPATEQKMIDCTKSRKKTLFLPYVGEFGHQIMTGIRIVHFNKSEYKIVCCRKGEEVLYPSASEFFTDWLDPIPDRVRVGSGRTKLDWMDIRRKFPDAVCVDAGGLHPIAEITALYPEIPIPFKPKLRGIKADVVLGVRMREFCPERNWKHWQQLADALTAAGYTFAVCGNNATSIHLIGEIAHTGDYDTDLAIELLQGAKLYVGGDSGNSHLASTTQVPMLIFREEAGNSRDLTPRMMETNPNITVLRDAWEKPDVVIAEVLKLLGNSKPVIPAPVVKERKKRKQK